MPEDKEAVVTDRVFAGRDPCCGGGQSMARLHVLVCAGPAAKTERYYG